MSTVFDVETGPLPEAELTAMMPQFEAPANYKDADKIKAVLDNKKKAWIEDAALDPLTGRVLAVGVLVDGQFSIIGFPNEADVLFGFWELVRGDAGRIKPIMGFNICGFDLPFLVRRSWHHRVPIPPGLRRGRYWADQIIDVRECWQLGDRQAKGSLDSIARHLGVGAKSGDGDSFAELWQNDRPKAEAYLRHDVEITAQIAGALGVEIHCA